MNENDQRIAIAEACGWKRTPYQSASLQVRGDVPFWTDGKSYRQSEHFPDYLHDLNAMYEAEKTLGHPEAFASVLGPILLRDKSISNMDGTTAWHFAYAHATAAQRAEAFLRTIGKWDNQS